MVREREREARFIWDDTVKTTLRMQPFDVAAAAAVIVLAVVVVVVVVVVAPSLPLKQCGPRPAQSVSCRRHSSSRAERVTKLTSSSAEERETANFSVNVPATIRESILAMGESRK